MALRGDPMIPVLVAGSPTRVTLYQFPIARLVCLESFKRLCAVLHNWPAHLLPFSPARYRRHWRSSVVPLFQVFAHKSRPGFWGMLQQRAVTGSLLAVPRNVPKQSSESHGTATGVQNAGMPNTASRSPRCMISTGQSGLGRGCLQLPASVSARHVSTARLQRAGTALRP